MAINERIPNVMGSIRIGSAEDDRWIERTVRDIRSSSSGHFWHGRIKFRDQVFCVRTPRYKGHFPERYDPWLACQPDKLLERYKSFRLVHGVKLCEFNGIWKHNRRMRHEDRVAFDAARELKTMDRVRSLGRM